MKILSALVTGSMVTAFLAFSPPLAAAPGGVARASGPSSSGHASSGPSAGHGSSGGRFFGGSRGGAFAHGGHGGGGHWHGGEGHWHDGFRHHHNFYPDFWGYGWYGYGYPYYPYGSYYSYDYNDWGPSYSYGPAYGDYGYGDRGSLAEDVQAELRREGYYRGRIDGIIGPATRDAIRSFQEDRGLPITGRIDRHLLHAMRFA
jgi:hypothetical protein